MVSSGTGFSPSVFSWINFVHDACHEKFNINPTSEMLIWIPCSVDNQDYDWSLKKVSSAKLFNIKEFSNEEIKMIFQIISKMTELSSLDLSGKHHYVLNNNFIFKDFKIYNDDINVT